jgi:hypothetical protein
MKLITDLYAANLILIVPFVIIFSVLSILLPTFSDNSLFYTSEMLFMLATTLIPINIFLSKKFSNNKRVTEKIYPFLEFTHIFSLITAIVTFSFWFLGLAFN